MTEQEELLYLLEEEYKDCARNSLLKFTEYTYKTYQANWHHINYAEILDKFIDRQIKNLMIFMPPQHGKSELSTRRTPAMILGKNPDCKIGVIAYNHTIAAKFNRDVQRIINTDEYKELFPLTTLNAKNIRTTDTYLRNSDEFEIVGYKGGLVSVGVGGALTSRTIDVLIMDDLYKDAQSAWSGTVRESVQDWYYTVGKTRLHNDSQQLLVFTRWHEEDLAGHLLSTEPEKWEVVIFPAIKVGNSTSIDPRSEGQALWQAKHSLETLEGIKKKNPIVFDSLYQQNPTPKEGLLLASSELKRFKRHQLTQSPDAIIVYCDIADEGDDNLAAPIGYIYGQDVYIVDVVFNQSPTEITQPMVAAAIINHKANKARFESNAGGKGYAQVIKTLIQGKSKCTIDWKATTQNKHTKIIMNSGQIKEHFYFLDDDEQSEEYRKYFHELTHYPKNGNIKHDDAIDSTAMLNEFINSGSSWGWHQ